MKKRGVFFCLVLCFVVLGLIACKDPNSSEATYTVRFEANGGSPAPGNKVVNPEDKVSKPSEMSRTGHTFGEWYKESTFVNLWDFENDIVTGNITLYAKWNPIIYSINFEADDGSPAPAPQSIAYGSKIVMPPGMTKNEYGFGGWFKEPDRINHWNFAIDTVAGNTTLYAKWVTPETVSGTSFIEKMQWLETNAQSGGVYIVEVDADESIGPMTLSYTGKTNISITLIGIGANRIISFTTYFLNRSPMFGIESDITLILDEKIELKGTDNSASLIQVNSGGSLILNPGAKITGNTTYSSYTHGGGVYVSGGIFTMNGGEISGNTVRNTAVFSYGGGVYVVGGTFTMNGGKISGNTVYCSASSSSPYINSYGGGVYVSGTFTMNGGEISGNSASLASGSFSSYGGGVYISSGTFTMTGGKISGNTSYTVGGGVYVRCMGPIRSTVFKKTGGTIFGYSTDDVINSNVAKLNGSSGGYKVGHAIYVGSDSSYIMGKDTSSGPENNLSFDETVTPPVLGGDWED